MIHDLPYDGGRRVSACVPSARAEAVVFAADGGEVSRWGALLGTADIPPTLIVGVHGLPDETGRLEEYSPAFDEERFAAHEKFFVDDVRDWTRRRLGVDLAPERTAVFGASAGGELAIALGLRHPEIYGAVLAGSPGAGYQPPASLPARLPRTYLVAGTREPFFLENARRWSAALHAADGEVVLAERDAGHETGLWRSEFPRMIAWAFGAARATDTGP